jgi:hypothetical protein
MGVFWCPHMDHILEGFFPSILWCSWSGNDPKDDLARFGYILDMKTRKQTKILLYILLPTGTYCKNMMILDIFPLKSIEFGFIFSCVGQNHFFQV